MGTVIRATNETSAALGRTRAATARVSSEAFTKPATPCGHHGAGQELCYLCHQRAKRNIPVYLHEEKRIREAEETKLLEQYQHNRDLEEQRKREVFLMDIELFPRRLFLGAHQSRS